jgi:hypothetical protein
LPRRSLDRNTPRSRAGSGARIGLCPFRRPRWRTSHDLRHTAAYRMACDPQMRLTDVQWVLGHAHLSTTQRYLKPVTEDVIAELAAHRARRPNATPPNFSTHHGGERSKAEKLIGTWPSVVRCRCGGPHAAARTAIGGQPEPPPKSSGTGYSRPATPSSPGCDHHQRGGGA